MMSRLWDWFGWAAVYLAVYTAALAVLVGAITIGLLLWMEALAP